jgi:hypothetical protein
MTKLKLSRGSRAETSMTKAIGCAIASVLLTGLLIGAPAGPATAHSVGDDTAVGIGVVIEPRADCAAVRPPCRCDAAGVPTLPPGLAKKSTLPPGQVKKSTLPPGQAKKPMLPPGQAEKPTLPPGQAQKASPPDRCAPRLNGTRAEGESE